LQIIACRIKSIKTTRNMQQTLRHYKMFVIVTVVGPFADHCLQIKINETTRNMQKRGG